MRQETDRFNFKREIRRVLRARGDNDVKTIRKTADTPNDEADML